MKQLLIAIFLIVGMNSYSQGGITNISSESSLGACDASVTAVFLADREYVSFYDQSFNVVRRDTLQWNWGGPGPWELFLTWDNLCTGVYYMVAQDTLGFVSDTTVIDLSALNTVNIYTQSYGESSPGLCDGGALFNIQGGVPPYQVVTYTADSSYFAVDSMEFSTLCDDIYTVHVVDSEGNSAFQVFNVISGTFSFNNPAIQDSVFQDSLSANAIQACNITYANVDSIYIDNYSVTVGEDSLIIYWTILMNDSTMEQIAQVYYLDTNVTTGNLLISLDIYCLTTKSSGTQLRALDIISLDQLSLTDHQFNQMHFNLFPNPSRDRISIGLDDRNYKIQIFDAFGKLVLNQYENVSGQIQIDVSNLQKGMYFVHVKGEGKLGIRKLIKE